MVESGILAKPLQRQRVSSSSWIDVEPLSAANLYLHEDEGGYSAAVKASHQKGIKLLYRVVIRFKLWSGSAEEGMAAILTEKAKAVATAKRWAADERAAARYGTPHG
jgi:hypothetical protein